MGSNPCAGVGFGGFATSHLLGGGTSNGCRGVLAPGVAVFDVGGVAVFEGVGDNVVSPDWEQPASRVPSTGAADEMAIRRIASRRRMDSNRICDVVTWVFWLIRHNEMLHSRVEYSAIIISAAHHFSEN